MELRPPDCDCEYCTEYRPLYDSIKRRPRWLTISPPYSNIDPDDYLREWNEEFFKFRYFADKILGVAEIANGRIHFHFVYEQKDPIKEYRHLNTIRRDSMVRVYNGYPEKGLHYLFKDIEESKMLFSLSPVITEASIVPIHKARSRKAKNKLLSKSIFEKWETTRSDSE